MEKINKSVGERIKNIRQQKMMTQKELCGSFMTRNMLSCIENGTANPSLKTLEYIAERLNVPAGILISEEEGNFTIKKSASIDNIRKAYRNGDFAICIDICNSLGETDDEISMIMAHAYLGCARAAFNEGSLKSMCEYVDGVFLHSRATMYSDESVIAEASCYLRYASAINPALSLPSRMHSRSWADDLSAFGSEFCRYAYALDAVLNDKHAGDVPLFLSNKIYSAHLHAVEHINNGDFGSALELLKSLIYGSIPFELPIMYVILKNAELCAKNVDDYKLAYEFSTSAISVLDNMVG